MRLLMMMAVTLVLALGAEAQTVYFQARTQVQFSSVEFQGPLGAIVGDFNRDGKADLAVPNQGTIGIAILLGKGDGTFLGIPQSRGRG